MNVQPEGQRPSDKFQQFEAALATAAQSFESLSTEELYAEFSRILELRHRDLRSRAANDPSQWDTCLAEAMSVLVAVVYVHRLQRGPTSLPHVHRLIDAFTPAEKDQLFFEREAVRKDAICRDTFARVCEHMKGVSQQYQAERDEAQQTVLDLTEEGVRIITQLQNQKAGPDKDYRRSSLLACVKVMSQMGVPYRESLPTFNAEYVRLGYTAIETKEELRAAISREKKENPFFEEILRIVKHDLLKIRDANPPPTLT